MKLPSLPSSEKMLRFAAVLALVALPLLVWSVFDPRVWPLMGALTIGQGIGTLSFAVFLVVVVRDLDLPTRLGLRRKREGTVTEGVDPPKDAAP